MTMPHVPPLPRTLLAGAVAPASNALSTVTVNGSPSAFHTTLLERLMKQPSMQARDSGPLSDALQRRILSQTLFTLGDVRP